MVTTSFSVELIRHQDPISYQSYFDSDLVFAFAIPLNKRWPLTVPDPSQIHNFDCNLPD